MSEKQEMAEQVARKDDYNAPFPTNVSRGALYGDSGFERRISLLSGYGVNFFIRKGQTRWPPGCNE